MKKYTFTEALMRFSYTFSLILSPGTYNSAEII